jgi:hypothetical protein
MMDRATTRTTTITGGLYNDSPYRKGLGKFTPSWREGSSVAQEFWEYVREDTGMAWGEHLAKEQGQRQPHDQTHAHMAEDLEAVTNQAMRTWNDRDQTGWQWVMEATQHGGNDAMTQQVRQWLTTGILGHAADAATIQSCIHMDSVHQAVDSPEVAVKVAGYTVNTETVRIPIQTLRNHVKICLSGIYTDVRDREAGMNLILDMVTEGTDSEYPAASHLHQSDATHRPEALQAWVQYLTDDGVRASIFYDLVVKNTDGVIISVHDFMAEQDMTVMEWQQIWMAWAWNKAYHRVMMHGHAMAHQPVACTQWQTERPTQQGWVQLQEAFNRYMNRYPEVQRDTEDIQMALNMATQATAPGDTDNTVTIGALLDMMESTTLDPEHHFYLEKMICSNATLCVRSSEMKTMMQQFIYERSQTHRRSTQAAAASTRPSGNGNSTSMSFPALYTQVPLRRTASPSTAHVAQEQTIHGEQPTVRSPASVASSAIHPGTPLERATPPSTHSGHTRAEATQHATQANATATQAHAYKTPMPVPTSGSEQTPRHEEPAAAYTPAIQDVTRRSFARTASPSLTKRVTMDTMIPTQFVHALIHDLEKARWGAAEVKITSEDHLYEMDGNADAHMGTSTSLTLVTRSHITIRELLRYGWVITWAREDPAFPPIWHAWIENNRTGIARVALGEGEHSHGMVQTASTAISNLQASVPNTAHSAFTLGLQWETFVVDWEEAAVKDMGPNHTVGEADRGDFTLPYAPIEYCVARNIMYPTGSRVPRDMRQKEQYMSLEDIMYRICDMQLEDTINSLTALRGYFMIHRIQEAASIDKACATVIKAVETGMKRLNDYWIEEDSHLMGPDDADFEELKLDGMMGSNRPWTKNTDAIVQYIRERITTNMTAQARNTVEQELPSLKRALTADPDSEQCMKRFMSITRDLNMPQMAAGICMQAFMTPIPVEHKQLMRRNGVTRIQRPIPRMARETRGRDNDMQGTHASRTSPQPEYRTSTSPHLGNYTSPIPSRTHPTWRPNPIPTDGSDEDEGTDTWNDNRAANQEYEHPTYQGLDTRSPPRPQGSHTSPGWGATRGGGPGQEDRNQAKTGFGGTILHKGMTGQEWKFLREELNKYPLTDINWTDPAQLAEWLHQTYQTAGRSILNSSRGTALWAVAIYTQNTVEPLLRRTKPGHNVDQRGLAALTQAARSILNHLNIDWDTQRFTDGGKKAEKTEWVEVAYIITGKRFTQWGESHKRRLRDIRWTEDYTLNGLHEWQNKFGFACENAPPDVTIETLAEIYHDNIPAILREYMQQEGQPLPTGATRTDLRQVLNTWTPTLVDGLKKFKQELEYEEPKERREHRRYNGRSSASVRGGYEEAEDEEKRAQLQEHKQREVFINQFTTANTTGKKCEVCGGPHEEGACFSLDAHGSKIPRALRHALGSREIRVQIHRSGWGEAAKALFKTARAQSYGPKGTDGIRPVTQHEAREGDAEQMTAKLQEFGMRIDKCQNPQCMIRTHENAWTAKGIRRNTATECTSCAQLVDVCLRCTAKGTDVNINCLQTDDIFMQAAEIFDPDYHRYLDEEKTEAEMTQSGSVQ